jgi:hypothetical protein
MYAGSLISICMSLGGSIGSAADELETRRDFAELRPTAQP